MTIGRIITIFVILITVYLVKTQTTRQGIIPDFRDSPFIKANVSKQKSQTADNIRTTTTMSPYTPTFRPLYDLIFSFSNVGLRKIGPDFIISDKIISLSLDNNEISYISPYAFHGMRNLVHLNLSGNKIPTEQLLSFVNVDGLQTLIIDNNNPISSTKTDDNDINSEPIISYGVFRRLEHLHICNSQLKDYQIHHMRVPALTNLYLSNNSIESSDIVFNNIPNTLRNLSIDNNLIDRVEKNNLRHLQQLIMDNNKITEVCFELCSEKSISLKGADNMKTLSLSKNQISKVSADAFKDTKGLVYLDLSGNNITEISKGTFNNTGWIKYLSLADNKFTTIPADICSLRILTSLNLIGNHISAVDTNNFCYSRYLRDLYLANNNISTIGSQAFVNLPALKYLDLSGNQLWQLPQQWANTYLEELHLEKNNFEELDHATLAKLMKLKDVYLSENPMLMIKAESFRSLSTYLTVHVKDKQIKSPKYDDYNDNDYNGSNEDYK